MHRVWVLERADQFFHAWLENGESRHPGCGLWIRYHIYESFFFLIRISYL